MVLAHWVRNVRMRFLVFVILSYQNACYGCENAENRTWSDLFLWRMKVLEAMCKVRYFRTLKNKYDLTLCQSRLHTASETFVRHKKNKNRIRFGFLRFCIRSMHFDRKGWRIPKKPEKHMWTFRTRCAMALNVIDTTWGRIYFLTCKNFRWKFRTPCAMAFTSTPCPLLSDW